MHQEEYSLKLVAEVSISVSAKGGSSMTKTIMRILRHTRLQTWIGVASIVFLSVPLP